MNNPASRRPLLVVLLILLAGSAYWIWFRLYTQITLEDAFITFRYAANLALGRGFVFNEGEKVLGTTTPLLTLVLSLLARLFGVNAIPLLSSTLMIAFGLLTAALNYAILSRLGYARVAACISVLFYLVSTRILVAGVGGMETPLVLFLMALSLYLFMRGVFTVSLVVCALLVLTRIDGIVWSLILLTAVLIKVRRLPRSAIVACGMVLIPWAVFAMSYFGSVLPHSIAAKQAIRVESIRTVTFLAAVKSFVGWYARPSAFPRPVFVLYLALVGAGGFRMVRDASTRVVGGVLLAFSAAFGVFLALGKAPHFDWYPVPCLWVGVVLCAAGVEALGEMLGRRLRPMGLGVLLGNVVVTGTLMLYCGRANRDMAEWHHKNHVNELRVSKAVGLWLRENSPVGSTVAMEAIGYQGFYSQRRVIDLAGLVSPAVVRFRKESLSNAEVFWKVVAKLAPDYIVLRSSEVEKNRHFHGGPLFENENTRHLFLSCYREVKRFGAAYPEVWEDSPDRAVYEREQGQCGAVMRDSR